ncbi:phosphoribosyltransferase [Paenibacillus sp. PR3]|uniref:Phosphoribosyltransferase n=1 Tax=Paenibacillus terricola TaxID=2763503 RepID=A0ABR8MZK3_9BACL|nr:phosphoribosyltransferase [Paenibacillus terricola]MBD3921362.1 phosphoribosyltransferase [Paenibacillus terricola]
MRRHIYLDYNAIALRLDAMAEQIKQARHEALVIILRGGSFSGVHLAFLTGLPIYFLRYDRTLQQVSWVGSAPEQTNVLLCEDFAGSGKTLINCKQFLEDAGYKTATCVVCVDRLSASVPDYSCFWLQGEDARIILPWERYRVNHAVDLGLGHKDLEYEKVGWDMDGVFLDDVASEHYVADLENALQMRDKLLPAPYAPEMIQEDIIITGRPTQDEERTRRWLQQHHRYELELHLRDDLVEKPTSQTTGEWKAKKALELGCTHYVESDAEQAVFIAALYPQLRVIWWNSGRPMLIQASRTTLRAPQL